MLVETTEMAVRIGIGADDDGALVDAVREPVGGHIGADAAQVDVQVRLGEDSLRHGGRTVAQDAEEVRTVVVDAVIGAEGADHAEAAVA